MSIQSEPTRQPPTAQQQIESLQRQVESLQRQVNERARTGIQAMVNQDLVGAIEKIRAQIGNQDSSQISTLTHRLDLMTNQVVALLQEQPKGTAASARSEYPERQGGPIDSKIDDSIKSGSYAPYIPMAMPAQRTPAYPGRPLRQGENPWDAGRGVTYEPRMRRRLNTRNSGGSGGTVVAAIAAIIVFIAIRNLSRRKKTTNRAPAFRAAGGPRRVVVHAPRYY